MKKQPGTFRQMLPAEEVDRMHRHVLEYGVKSAAHAWGVGERQVRSCLQTHGYNLAWLQSGEYEEYKDDKLLDVPLEVWGAACSTHAGWVRARAAYFARLFPQVAIEDLISEGNMALRQALVNYSSDTYELLTYAAPIIMQRMLKYCKFMANPTARLGCRKDDKALFRVDDAELDNLMAADDSSADKADKLLWVKGALSRVKNGDLVYERYFLRRTLKEMGIRLGMSPQAVYTKIKNVSSALRELYEKENG